MGCFHKGGKPGADAVPSTGSALMEWVQKGLNRAGVLMERVTVNHQHVTKEGGVMSQV